MNPNFWSFRFDSNSTDFAKQTKCKVRRNEANEVKRMIRQMTPHPDQMIVQALMDFVKEEKVDTCIHSQSLFHVLFEN